MTSTTGKEYCDANCANYEAHDGPLAWLVTLLDHDPTHVSKWGRRSWLDLLREGRFEVVGYDGLVRRLVGSHYIQSKKPQSLLRSIVSTLYLAARKRG